MDIKQLQYLVVSIDNGSFKKASELLYTTQPHISKTIKSLEVELGMQLLKRNARGVEATEEGRKVYEYACRILVDSGKIQHVREEKDIRMLKIAVTPDDELNHLFRTFYAQEVKEGLHVEYMERNAEELLRMVHHHRVDIGFLLVDQNQKTALLQMLAHKRLEFTEIGKRSPVLLAGSESPLYGAESVSNKELREIKLIQMDADQDMFSIQLVHGKEDYQYHRVHGKTLMTNSRDVLLELVSKTDLCSISACGDSLQETGRRIRQIPIKGEKDRIILGYVKRKRDELTAEAEKFLAYICENLGN